MNRLVRGCAALFLLLACRNAGAETTTVTGLFNLDALPDTLTYSDPDDSGIVTIEITLTTVDGKAEKIVRKYTVSEYHVLISSKRAGEINIFLGGDLGGSIKYYQTFSYNRRVNDWFLTRDIMFEPQPSGEGYDPPIIAISYDDGNEGLGGARIERSDTETEAPRARSARLSKELSALHNSLMSLHKAHKFATIPESAYDRIRLAEIIYNVPITEQTVEAYNNIGFFLGEKEEARYCAAYVLDKVIKANPDRTAAYLNIADVYFKIDSLPNAKAAYARYIELMKEQGKEKKIPQRVLDRAR